MARVEARSRSRNGGAAGNQNGGELHAPKITWVERERIAKQNRAFLDRDLLERRLVFESRPYEAHVGFSNFCNMSCIMCWDGENPPLQKMEPDVLEKVATQVAPTLSVITPHSGSEPLVASWDETVTLARDYSVQLALTTNVQFLDEPKFHELKDHVEMVVMSIDSHQPELFMKIRPGAKADKVFENLPRAAKLCEEHGIECIVQVVFMTENAPTMPETIAYMADAGVQGVNVIQLIDINGRSGYLDPSLHFSSQYIEWIRQKCVAVAKEKRIRFGWDLSGVTWLDFREPTRKIRPRRSKCWNDSFDHLMKLRQPGFCKYAYDRLLIETSGVVAPCGLASDGELNLGDLATQDFDEIWNGPSAQDLRRGHYTWDYPSLCKTCRFVDRIGPQTTLPFVASLLNDRGLDEEGVDATLVVEEPAHMERCADPPTLRFRRPDRPIARYVVAFSLGGEPDHVVTSEFEPSPGQGGLLEWTLPAELWAQLDTNLGWWWCVFGTSSDEFEPDVRASELRCVIRHEEIARIEGSSMGYPDEGHIPIAYMGGERQVGWGRPDELPARPVVRQRTEFMRRRHTKRERSEPADGTDGAIAAEDYAELVDAVRAVVGRLIPSDAVVAVVSRGDDALLELDVADARHFPGDAHGAYAGYYPRDDDAAIEQLEQMRAGGAEFIVFPVTAFWWLEHYVRLGEHLDRYALLADHQGKYMIWDLREQLVPATVRLPEKRAESHRAAAPRSMMRRADEVLGYGGQHRTALRPFYGESGGDVLPSFAVAADGYELVDSAGRTFVDWVGGGGPVLLGYRHPAVEEAIRKQLEAGPTLTLMHAIEVEVATMLTEMIPCAEMVAFGKNGSDALAGAIRVARAATGREVLLQHGMHGFHEWFACMHPGVKGIPNIMRALVHPLPFNDLDGLAGLFERFDGEVAAVVMEPATSLLPEPGYLEGVRDLAHAHGALLVFDEMVTGFRFANGGGQELYGVTPDLACFGKGLANGMPLSAIVGKREYMELLTSVAYGMTFRGETLSLAAARAVLETLADEPAAEHIANTGAILRDEFQQACAEAGISARLLGHESRLSFVFDQHVGVSHEQASAIFIRGCARAGVLTNGSLLPSLAHDDEAIRRTAAAFRSAAGEVAKIVSGGLRVLGDAVRAGFTDEARDGAGPVDGLPAGYLDSVRETGAELVLHGWILLADGPADRIELVAPGGGVVACEAYPRPDLASAFPAAPGAEMAGFVAQLPARRFAPGGDYEFTLRARRGDREMLRCPIVRKREEHGDPAHQPWLGSDGVLHL